MGLLRIEAPADVLISLKAVPGLQLVAASIEDVGGDRFQMSGYGSEALVAQLEALGCTVEVLMSTDSLDAFHARVSEAVADQSSDTAPEA